MQHRSRFLSFTAACGLAVALTANADTATPPSALQLFQSAPEAPVAFMASQSARPWFSERWWQVLDGEALPLLRALPEDEPLYRAMLWWWQALVQPQTSASTGQGHALVAYVSGALPVLQIGIADPDHVRNLINRFEEETGIRSREYPVAGEPLRIWELFPPGWPGMDLGVRIEPDRVTLSVLVEGENTKQQALRFGMGSHVRNLTDSDRWRPLLETLEGSDAQIAAVDLAQLAATLLDESATPLRRDLENLLPEIASELPLPMTRPACRRELLHVLEQIPEATLTIVRTGESESAYFAEQTLRIADPVLLQTLQELPGTLPHYAVADTGALFSLAVGIDADGLTNLVLETAERLRESDSGCQPTVEFLATQANTIRGAGAGLMAASALVRAVGIAAYPGHDGLPTVIASVHSGFPAQLAAGLQLFFPDVFGNGIPDGELAALTGLPALLPVSVGRRDDALIMALGDPQTLDIEQLLAEKVDDPESARGVFATRFDYGAIGDGMLSLLSGDSLAFPLNTAFAAMEAELCERWVLSALQLRSLGLKGGARATIDARGIVDSGNWHLSSPLPLPDRLTGVYTVSELTSGCRWAAIGEETIEASGVGRYAGYDSSGQCTVDELEYRWTRSGTRFEQQQTGSRYRDDCTAAWVEDSLIDEVCVLNAGLGSDDFFCVYPGDDAPILLLYRPVPGQ